MQDKNLNLFSKVWKSTESSSNIFASLWNCELSRLFHFWTSVSLVAQLPKMFIFAICYYVNKTSSLFFSSLIFRLYFRMGCIRFLLYFSRSGSSFWGIALSLRKECSLDSESALARTLLFLLTIRFAEFEQTYANLITKSRQLSSVFFLTS